MGTKICVVGLGYVGLPLALELSNHFDVTGFEINEQKVSYLLNGIDPSDEISEKKLKESSIKITSDKKKISDCNFIIICVPTPIDNANKPDLTCLRNASEMVGAYLSKESIVVYESTVYPGVTEEVCLPILEEKSRMRCLADFKIGYSPERINPGDKTHTIDKITKIVSGIDKESLDIISSVYGKITKVHKSPSIKVAEAAKVIENIQRDLNIALMNELSIIFDKLRINTNSVLEAAGTKWNFHKYHPGLVGGHCIGVDPYYLTYKANQIGYNSKVILSGRKLNDSMAKYISEEIITYSKNKNQKGEDIKGLILGVTFKENCPDIRNSKVVDIYNLLSKNGILLNVYDPFADKEEVKSKHGIDLINLSDIKNKYFNFILVAVSHSQFINLNLNKYIKNNDSLIYDLKGIYNNKNYRRL